MHKRERRKEMSKKHFIILADMIREANQTTPGTFNCYTIDKLADFCASQNPNFKRERWLEYIAGKCGKNGGAVKQPKV